MCFSGVVFDFNGTLFQDSPLHEQAWKEEAAALLGRAVSTEEYYQKLNGKSNRLIMEYLMGDAFNEEVLEQAEAEKEARYRALCLEEPGRIRLTAGAEELFDWLKAQQIPMAIATASEQTNVAFYREQFRLERWFTPGQIVYNDKTFPLKPKPDIYYKAAAVLGLAPGQLIICEDSYVGLQAARAAGAGWLYAIAAGEETRLGAALIDAVIPDFHHFDRNLLLK